MTEPDERDERDEIAGVLGEHVLHEGDHGPTCYRLGGIESCGWTPPDDAWEEDFGAESAYLQHVAAELLASDWLAERDRRTAAQALRDAAGWIAEGIGYPIQCTMPDHPMPDALWDALVDHIHHDDIGRWHGNELDRAEVDAWLRAEAGRADEIEGADTGADQ